MAKICLAHSFCDPSTKYYIGNFDTSNEELELINTTLAKINLNDYDKLIQLCDA